jgi:type IV secretory pathway TraG/TraD family ATPase VirD4
VKASALIEDFASARGMLMHGPSGLILAYGISLLGVCAGLWLAHAPVHRWWLGVPAALGALLIAGLLGALLRSALANDLGAGVLSMMLALLLYPAVGAIIGLAVGRNGEPRGRHRRGARVLDMRARSRAVRHRGGGAAQVTLAGVAVPARDETKHFKLIGTTGTGKSTAIRELLEAALRRGDRAVVTDPEGAYLGHFFEPSRGDVVLNPFEPRSLRWDPFAEVTEAYDMDQLARALVPDGDSGPGREWRGYARTFISSVLRQLQAANVRDCEELYRVLMMASVPELRTLLDGTAAQAFVEADNERMFRSIRSVAAHAVSALEFIASQRAAAFGIRNWVRSGRGSLFLPYSARQIATLAPVISAWVRIAIFETMTPALGGAEADQRLWFIVDELDALGAIDGLKDALARLRKFGGRCVLGLQSIAQVSATYGAQEAHTIVENCGNSLILRCSASEHGGTARFASQLIGQREVVRPQLSVSREGGFGRRRMRSRSQSDQVVIEDAVLPSEIEQLPDLSGYLKLATSPDWLRVEFPPPLLAAR